MSVVEASSDLLLTGFPNEIARNKSIQMLKDLKSTATNLTKEDLEDIQFVIETMTEDIVIEAEEEQPNTPLWWFRYLNSVLKFAAPAYIPCTGTCSSAANYFNVPNASESSMHPLLFCKHLLKLHSPPCPFLPPLSLGADGNTARSLNKSTLSRRNSHSRLDGISIPRPVSPAASDKVTISVNSVNAVVKNGVSPNQNHDLLNDEDEIWDLGVVTKPRAMRVNELVMELHKISSWDFDIFRTASLSHGWPLIHVGYAFFNYFDLFNLLGISEKTCVTFLLHIEYGCNYSNNPFHNSLHVADMLQACHVLLFQLRLLGKLSDFDILAVFLAAIIHDYRHAGLTNQYLIASQDSVAIIYNDIRLVENFACSSAFRLLASPELECDLLSVFEPIIRQKIRQQVIALVFSTNTSDHFFFLENARKLLLVPQNPIVSPTNNNNNLTSPKGRTPIKKTKDAGVASFKNKVASPLLPKKPSATAGTPTSNAVETEIETDLEFPSFAFELVTPHDLVSTIDFTSKADLRADCVLKLIMKAADISQSARSWGIYSRWSQLIMEEYYLQGDLEREQEMVISDFMDRNSPREAICHELHVRTIVLPVFQLLSEVMGMNMTGVLMEDHKNCNCRHIKGSIPTIVPDEMDSCFKHAVNNVDNVVNHWTYVIKNFESKSRITQSPNQNIVDNSE